MEISQVFVEILGSKGRSKFGLATDVSHHMNSPEAPILR